MRYQWTWLETIVIAIVIPIPMDIPIVIAILIPIATSDPTLFRSINIEGIKDIVSCITTN